MAKDSDFGSAALGNKEAFGTKVPKKKAVGLGGSLFWTSVGRIFPPSPPPLPTYGFFVIYLK